MYYNSCSSDKDFMSDDEKDGEKVDRRLLSMEADSKLKEGKIGFCQSVGSFLKNLEFAAWHQRISIPG